MRLPLRWKILLGYLVVAGLTLGAAGWFALDALEAKDIEELRTSLAAQAHLAGRLFATPLARTPADSRDIDSLADRLGDAIHARVTIIGVDGVVLGDSYESGEALHRMDNHLMRPEVRDAAATGLGVSIRVSSTLGIRMLNLALPIRTTSGPDVRSLGFVRLSVPLTEIEAHHHTLRGLLAVALGGAFLVSLALSYLVARGITRPLADMISTADRLARGELHGTIRTRSNDEVADLAHVLNRMATSLAETIQLLSEDRARIAATLAAMEEGVMVLSSDGTVRLINPAMERMLGQRQAEVVGRTDLEATRHPHLNEFIAQVLRHGGSLATEITMGSSPAQTFRVQASTLPNPGGQTQGAVFVFHDITDLRRLEQVRKDFVANVSHELRTPLTAIKGYVEALQDTGENPQERDRFLDVIRRHADRLDLIITDLLLLSKIESGLMPLKLGPVALSALVDRTVASLQPVIERKRHRIVKDFPPDLPPVLGDEERLGQVLSNLFENAVKYTLEGGTITASGRADHDAMLLTLSDTGIGIPPQDLPRVFERFYRVDKGRSRDMGGTGLGLSIVKHLVEAHGGTVMAASPPGGGACFTIRLPITPGHA